MPNLKKERLITKEIEALFKATKLNKDLKLNFSQSWMFPDGYVHSVSKDVGRVVSLLYKDKPIGVLGFKVFQRKKDKFCIDLKFVQGVNSGVSPSTLKKLKWKEMFVESFLEPAVVTSLKSNSSIVYSDVVRIREDMAYYKARGFDGKNYDTFLDNYCKKEGLKKLTPKEKTAHINRLKSLQNEQQFINSLRDRYFDRNGNLNSKRSRVKNIYKRANRFIKMQNRRIKNIRVQKRYKATRNKIKNKKRINVKIRRPR